jgi:hypothetical protein
MKFKFRRTKFTELTDNQWFYIEKWIEGKERKRKYPLRKVINCILKLTHTGGRFSASK